MMNKTCAVIGGDVRQLRAAALLEQRGWVVLRYGFDKMPKVRCCALEQAVTADLVILPLPLSRDGETLCMPLALGKITLAELWPLLDSRRQLICGGVVKPEITVEAARHHVEIVDYFAREDVQVGNAVPTVEGALWEAMAASEQTIHGSQALVIGAGRIGKLLAQRLLALGAEVTVSARKTGDLAWIRAIGCRPIRTGQLDGVLGHFNLVFNTVPALILHRGLLEQLAAGCVVVDVASDPGGTDFSAAKELGIQTIWARALPGRVAPATAAKVLCDAIDHILEERGEPI